MWLSEYSNHILLRLGVCPPCLCPHDWGSYRHDLRSPPHYSLVAFQFHSEYPGLPPRELPKKKLFKEESKVSEEELPDAGDPAWRQKKQLLVDCLTAIIRYPLLCAPSSSSSHPSGCTGQSFRSSSAPLSEEKRILLQDPPCWRTLGTESLY